MDAYIDLSMLLEVALTIINLYFISNIQKEKIKIRYYIILSMLNSIYTFGYYFSLFINLIIKLISIILFFIIIQRKNKKTTIILYIISDLSFRLIIPFLFKDIVNFRNILLISNKNGLWVFLFLPFHLLSIFLSTKFTDYVYHLGEYKTNCILEYLNQRIYVSAYFDTGNTLKYDDTPVVFISMSNFPFSIDDYVEIDVEGITGTKSMRACPCLLSFDSKHESNYIYLALSENETSFHGCEVLLNAYLK